MKKIIITFSLFIFLIFNSLSLYADGHSQELPNVSNVQVNVCKLNDGVSLEEYNEVK